MLLEILCLDGNLLKFASQRRQTDREIAPGRSWGVLYWYHSIHVCCTYIVVFRYSRTVEVYKLCQFHKMSSSWGTSSSAACRGSLAICFWRVSQSKIWRNDTRSKAMGSMYGTQFWLNPFCSYLWCLKLPPQLQRVAFSAAWNLRCRRCVDVIVEAVHQNVGAWHYGLPPGRTSAPGDFEAYKLDHGPTNYNTFHGMTWLC